MDVSILIYSIHNHSYNLLDKPEIVRHGIDQAVSRCRMCTKHCTKSRSVMGSVMGTGSETGFQTEDPPRSVMETGFGTGDPPG